MIIQVHVRDLVFSVQCATGHQPIRWLGFVACQRYGLEKGHLHQQQFLPQAVMTEDGVVLDPSKEISEFFTDNSSAFVDISGGTKSFKIRWEGRLETPPAKFENSFEVDGPAGPSERSPNGVDLSWLKKFDFKKFQIDKLIMMDLKRMGDQELEALSKSYGASTSSNSGEYLRAIRDFSAGRPDQLSIRKGDMVRMIDNTDLSWWKGEIGGKIGVFPAGSLELEQAISSREFTGTKPEELNFQKGDLITLLDRSDHNWWRGQQGGKIGVFPRTFVTLIPRNENGELESGTKVLAIRDSGTTSSDELSFSKNDIISVLDITKPDRWKGSSNGFVGYFDPSDTCMLQDAGIGAAKARRDFSASKAGELPFKRGERIILLEKTNGDLWKGMLRGRVGVFPASNVDPEQYVAISNHEVTNSDDLGFSVHAVLNVIDKSDANRWTGEYHGKVGGFPPHCIARAEQYPANRDYRATRGEELSLRKGDLITILEKDNHDYYLVNANGSVGYIPKYLVTITEMQVEEPKTELLSIRDCVARDSSDLSFPRFAQITLLDCRDKDVWKGRIGEKVGYFPKNLVEPILSQKHSDNTAESKSKKSSIKDEILEAEFNSMRRIFTERAGFIRNLFTYYSTVNVVGYTDVQSMSNAQFISFAKECKMISPQFKQVDLDIIFVASNAKAIYDQPGQMKHEVEKIMSIQEFLASMIRIAQAKYKQTQKTSERLRTLMENDVVPNAMSLLHDLVKRFKPLHTPQVKAVVEKLNQKLGRLFSSLVFEEHSESNTISFNRLLQFARQFDLFGNERLSVFSLRTIFMYATSVADDSTDVNLNQYLPEANYEQFVMILLCIGRHVQTANDASDLTQLPGYLELFLNKLL